MASISQFPQATGRGLWNGIMLILAGFTAIMGLGTAVLGVWLGLLGGGLYYAICGGLLTCASVLIFLKRPPLGFAIFAGAVALTLIWSIWEVAGKGWLPSWGYDLAGRAGVITGLFLATYGAWAMSHPPWRRMTLSVAGVLVVLFAVLIALFWERPKYPLLVAASPSPSRSPPTPADTRLSAAALPDSLQKQDWSAYGGSNLGRRFSSATQITPANVQNLQEAWRFSTEDMPANDRVFFSAQNTPLKVGDSLYVCSSGNKVFALDPATGALQWRFDPDVPPRAMESLFSVACRAVGYYETGEAQQSAACARRIYVATADGRLIGLDAGTGELCSGFGNRGSVDLSEGMDMGEPGFASNTSGPTIAGDAILIGQQVSDNQRRDAPSGVVRAYDARTGAFRWAWDARRTDRPQTPLAPGEVWPKGTPNVWNVISADESLGLAFLGTGNPGNDHFGGNRSPEDDAYTSAIVAVDLDTGTTRWVFRTVENDRFDYDIGAQPVILDMDIEGVDRRVVVQATKTGWLFVLDAQTGEPVRPVQMSPAPQGGLPGETLSPVQPESPFYPNLSGIPGARPERIDARHMFGLTPLDAAWCRIQFQRMRYEGIYTPPTDEGLGMLLLPGTIGGPNWGGISVDETRGIAIINYSRLANHVTLYPREDVGDIPVGDGGARPDQAIYPQAGSPWGVNRPIWMSPLNVPCIAPPWGFLAAVDLASGDLQWAQPLGTGYDMGPLGIPSRIRIPIGTPNVGGPLTTASGLTFIAAAQDNYLRAFETETGRLLWSGRLPAGGQAGPMTYIHDGRQYVAMNANGHARLETKVGDTLIVYALED